MLQWVCALSKETLSVMLDGSTYMHVNVHGTCMINHKLYKKIAKSCQIQSLPSSRTRQEGCVSTAFGTRAFFHTDNNVMRAMQTQYV